MTNDTNHQISLQQAIDMTSLYRENRPENFPICETFNKSAILALLAHEEAAFLRIYYGMKENGLVDAVLVAANANEEDLLPMSNFVASGTVNGSDGLILEDGFRCPQYCPPSSPLNS